jgi:hypothetical protein
MPTSEFRRYGQELDPYIDDRVLSDILTGWPEIVKGLVTKLAAHPPQLARDLFGRTDVIRREDLRGQPALAELWLLGARARGTLTAMGAFHDIRKLRLANGGVLDAALLDELWPDGCSSEDLRTLLPAAAEASLAEWLIGPISQALDRDSGDSRVALAKALEPYPEIRGLLPADLRRSADGLSKVGAVLKDARARVAGRDTKVFKELYYLYQHGDKQAKGHLRKRIPGLLCEAERLDLALGGCPEPVWRAFRGEVRDRLTPLRADPELAARVFLAMWYLEERGDGAAAQCLTDDLGQVLRWSGSQRRALRRALGRDTDAFDQWWEANRGGALVKIRGLLRTRKDGGRP